MQQRSPAGLQLGTLRYMAGILIPKIRGQPIKGVFSFALCCQVAARLCFYGHMIRISPLTVLFALLLFQRYESSHEYDYFTFLHSFTQSVNYL